MGSSCSSAQKKKDKDRQNAQGGQSPIGTRRRSTDSLPYGKGSPSSSRRPSFDPNSAPAPVAEQAESPSGEGAAHKVPVDAALSSVSAGGSSCSPPPGTMGTPIIKDAPSLDALGLPDLQRFPDHVRSLILGSIDELEVSPPLQEIILYIAADFYDSVVERDALVERIFPYLRRYTAEKGYELNVTDLHWGIPGVGLVDHNLQELCMGMLEKWRTRRRLLTLVIFNDNIGATLLPCSLPKPHFESGMEAIEDDSDRELFNKWYKLDAKASPMVYVLQNVVKHYPAAAGEDPDERKIAIGQWKEEAQRMITVLGNVLPDGQKQKNLTSVLQEEIKFIVSDDPQEAKRVLWMQRRFTHAKPPEKQSPNARRIDQSKIQLEDYLPDTQKLVFYVKWHEEGIDPQNFEADEQYISDVCDALKDELKKMIDGLLEEDFLDQAHEVYKGIEQPLYIELTQHYQECHRLSKEFTGRDSSLQAIKDYILGNSNHPLVIHGPPGCGKTSLIAKATVLSSSWSSYLCTVTRLVGLTAESTTQEQLLRSISEQCCALYGEHPAIASLNINHSDCGLGKLLEKVSEQRPLVLMIDGIDQLAEYSSKDFHWLPRELPTYVKLVLTMREESSEMQKMKDLLEGCDCFLVLEHPATDEVKSYIEGMLTKKKKHLEDTQKKAIETGLQSDPNAWYGHLLSLVALQMPDILNDEIPKSTADLVTLYLSHVERTLGVRLITFVLGLLVAAKHGLSQSEMLDILSCEDSILNVVFCKEEPRIRRFPAVLWMSVKKYLAPFIHTQVLGGRTLVKINCDTYRTIIAKYLQDKGHTIKASAQVLVDYFFGKWAEGRKKPISPDAEKAQDRFVLDQPLVYGPNPNRRKLEELPHQVLQVNDSIRDNFLFDATWLLYKFCGSDPYQLLEDLSCYQRIHKDHDKQLELLNDVVQLSSYALRNDGSQFFAQMYGRLKNLFKNTDVASQYTAVKSIYDTSCKPPLSSLLPLGACLKEPTIADSHANSNSDARTPETNSPTAESKGFPFTGLYTLKDDNQHAISISSDHNEIVVWSIYEESAVRRITGINQPKDIKMIDAHRALVLCNRELKVYHLDKGTLVVKLKGVMNQKMAYYGLHDENYAVALSRNRMYVNMTNLETGDLETTFKVGEDRFLNSLLVSANGKICVCGDETQKPFPLLVWDLTSRKLVYDLRIPHHEFVTRLSAISDDGHYVVSVCRELHDASPNFIIVYDLQSGTLFKKWKPESSSCSIAISSQGGCVVNGLENTWVLVWDLSTGARRFTLRGHSAPVDQIRMDEEGGRCLTYDTRARDRSVRVWDVKKGECLAVFTPDQDFSCCELSIDGKAVVLGLKGSDTITTLLLCRESTVDEETPEAVCYGDPQFKHKVFDMSQNGQ